MDNATLQPLTPNTVAAETPPGFVARLAALPMPRKLLLGAGVLALAAVLVAAVMMNRGPDYKVLFANLSDKDGGAIIAQLAQMNVPYRHTEGGGAILVPADKVHDIRLKLAQSGLPKGARVHLALPNQNGFFREQQKPSASVLLTLHPGRTLDRDQIAGIVHLVSSSVPELNPKAVSVVDSTGALLWPARRMAGVGAATAWTRSSCATSRSRDRPPTPSASWTCWSRWSGATTCAPPSPPTSTSRSRVRPPRSSAQPGRAEPAAVRVRAPRVQPGRHSHPAACPARPATSRRCRPPRRSTVQAAAAAGRAGRRHRSEAPPRGVRHQLRGRQDRAVTRNATGSVRRLNAAVVVNHRSSTDAKGKPTDRAAVDEEIDKLTALVQQGIGFSKERGDSVRVVNAPFRVEAGRRWPSRAAVAAALGAATCCAAGLARGAGPGGADRRVRRSSARRSRPAARATAAEDSRRRHASSMRGGAGDDDGSCARRPGRVLPAPAAQRQRPSWKPHANLAKENPAAVANIVRGWVNGGEVRPEGALPWQASMDDKGLEDAAILLMSLGEEEAAEVFKHLAPKEVQRLGETIARMLKPSARPRRGVLDRFDDIAAKEQHAGGRHRRVRQGGAAQGAGRRQGQPADRPHPAGQRHHRHREPEVDGPSSVAELLRNEHPQIVAAILVHLDFDQAADVLKPFPSASATR
jgi:flagellar M-ring protein FliF